MPLIINLVKFIITMSIACLYSSLIGVQSSTIGFSKIKTYLVEENMANFVHSQSKNYENFVTISSVRNSGVNV